MKVILGALVLALLLTTAVAAQTSIKGIELSPEDAARVDRQCDVLRFRMSGSLAATPPEEPPPGAIPADPSSYWAESADGLDAALARVNLNTISIRDCREAGFYD